MRGLVQTWWRPLTSEHLKSNALTSKSEHTSGVETIERPEIGSMLYVRQPRTDFEEAVRFRVATATFCHFDAS